MSEWNQSRGLAFGAISIAVLSLGVSGVALACRVEPDRIPASTSVTPPTAAAPAPAKVAAEPPKPANEEKPLALFGTVAALLPAPAPAKSTTAVNGLVVKRFVVTSGIAQREPLIGAAPLLADGNPVYAFAELSNQSDEQQVSVTFERAGSPERVGHASLKVPANVPRHRTWANTRFIREPGTWEAVLWNAKGDELARTSFAVGAK